MSPHIHLLDFDHNVIIFVGQRGAGVRSFIARASGELEMPRYSTAVDIEESVNGAMRVKRYHLINDPSRPFGLAPHHRVRDHCVGIIAVYNNTATDSLDTALRELDTARIAVVQHSAVRRPPIVYLVANNRNLDDCTSANLVAPETGREAAESAGAVFAEVSCQRRRRSAVVPSLLRRITATLSTQPAVSPLGGGVRLPLCPPQPT